MKNDAVGFMTYSFAIDKAMRAARLKQIPVCFWFTGLSGAGKSTIANAFEQALWHRGLQTFILDADSVRQGLNADLGYGREARSENVRRIGHVARLMVDAGLIVIVCSISPYLQDRQLVRSLFKDGEFVEVFVSTSLETCVTRDTKGLYARARQGHLRQLSGWDYPYETPTAADVELRTEHVDVDQAVLQLMTAYDALPERVNDSETPR